MAVKTLATSSHAAGEGADLVEGGGEGDEPVAGDPAVGRLEAGDTTEGGGLADRPAGVGPEGEGDGSGRDDGGASAAAAPRHPLRVPGVPHRAIGRVLVGGAHGELVAVGHRHRHGPGVEQPSQGGAGVGRDEALEDPRAGGGLHPLHAEDVLVGEGDPAEGPGGLRGLGEHARGSPGLPLGERVRVAEHGMEAGHGLQLAPGLGRQRPGGGLPPAQSGAQLADRPTAHDPLTPGSPPPRSGRRGGAGRWQGPPRRAGTRASRPRARR